MKKIAVFNPLASGGIADYLHFQANALEAAGVSATLVVSSDFKEREDRRYQLAPILPPVSDHKIALLRKGVFLMKIVADVSRFVDYVIRHDFKHVLLGAFAEYGSPFWVGHLKRLRRQGITIGCIIHDPIRDFRLGPKLFHELSIRLAYRSIDLAFVHHQIILDTAGANPSPRTVVLPFPSYPFPASKLTGKDFRAELEIPSNAGVLLSFGHIRDGKNLDLILMALVDHPRIHLIVAGKEQSSGDRPVAYYLDMAQSLGVSNRVHIVNRFIEQSELASLFEAADFAVLTYSSAFHSGSAALGTCAHFQKRMLASAAEGPLIESVSQFDLGVCVDPDSAAAISSGLRELVALKTVPRWADFNLEYSWEKNAVKLIGAFNSETAN